MNTPHKHAELIKAWADDAEIEWYDSSPRAHRWKGMEGHNPSWCDSVNFRVKPEPVPDFKKSYFVHGNHFQGLHISARLDEAHNLTLTFDGETGKLKSAEVL
jgi:hypothetical protein